MGFLFDLFHSPLPVKLKYVCIEHFLIGTEWVLQKYAG